MSGVEVPEPTRPSTRREALIEYALRYGPRCRDCADESGACPMSGMACGERRKATEFVVDALMYGAAHGYCPATLATPDPALPHPDVDDMAKGEVTEHDKATAWKWINMYLDGEVHPADHPALSRHLAEARLAQPITEQPSPVGEGEPVAYLKHWWTGGQPRCCVDLKKASEPWLDDLNPTVTALYPATPPSDDAARIKVLEEALEPFAKCADELDGGEDVPRAPDGEWAKFRLLTDDYRRARVALGGRHDR